MERGGGVWFVAFESQRVAGAGGLGDAVANLSEALSRQGTPVTVFLPSHGVHKDRGVRERLGLHDAGVSLRGVRIGYDGSLHPYSIGVEEGECSRVGYRLFKGLDQTTSKWLDQRPIYGGDEEIYQKMSLMARGLRGLVDGGGFAPGRAARPSVIHIHDWHSIPAGVSAWERLGRGGRPPALVFTSHLLGYKRLSWHYMSADWSGLAEDRGGHNVWMGGSLSYQRGFKEVWESLSDGFIEKFGSYEADFVTSVSRSYLGEVLGFVGRDVGGKSDFVYNGCDWDYQGMMEAAGAALDPERGRGSAPPTRRDLRRYLLEGALAEHGRRGGFNRDGPLALMTGRFDRQKGVDVLLAAVPRVVEEIPRSRFLLLLLPGGGDGSYAEEARKAAGALSENVRIVEGGSGKPIYRLAYLSADVYVVPSRWEPFGITALEAMASGDPVAGSSTGGIRETVVDLLQDRDAGTGILVPPEDSAGLARGIVSLLTLMTASEGGGGDPLAIAHEPLRRALAEDPAFGAKLRERCVRRVRENFTWEQSARKMASCYRRAEGFAEARSRAEG